MRTRIDIFPTLSSKMGHTWYQAYSKSIFPACLVRESEIQYKGLDSTKISERIEFYGTDCVDVDLESNPSEARYIHYRKLP